MADFQIPDKDLLTSVDRAADSLLVYDASALALKRATVNNLLDLTSHPVGIDDSQTLTLKNLTTPTISSPVLSGTVTGTYTLAGTPTFPSTVVTTTGSQTLSNKILTAPTINTATIANPTLTVDTVSEFTAANGVTIDGLNIKDGKLNTANSVVATNITDGIITNAKLSTTTGEIGGSWQDWTPTLTNLSGGTLNFAKYMKVGKTVHFRFYYTLAGAGISGSVTISPPVTIASGLDSTHPIGVGSLLDFGTLIYQGVVLAASTTAIGIRVNNASATYTTYTQLSSTVPFTWGATDAILISGSYEAA